MTFTSQLYEFERLEVLRNKKDSLLKCEVIAEVSSESGPIPIVGITLGSLDPKAPSLGLFGGVHGLERIGSSVVLAILEHFLEQLSWDKRMREEFQNFRIASIPIVNPWGIIHHARSNANGVDLMRNAAVEAEVTPPFILGGHRISNRLPYYRGPIDGQMEIEARALIDFVRTNLFNSSTSMALDVHSGFGARDRLWYPYAKTTRDFSRIREVRNISSIIETTFPNHIYLIESQSASYTTHGDLWDFLFDEFERENGNQGKVFIPWTLEMGSWSWLKKNPTHLLSLSGFFDPILPHRRKRILRRHLVLIYLLKRIIQNYSAWAVELSGR